MVSEEDRKRALEAARKIGVSNPENPTSEDIQKVLDAFLKEREISYAVFKDYIGLMSTSLTSIFEGLKAFSADAAGVTKEVLERIKQAIDILGIELAREDLSPEERIQIRTQIVELIAISREEARDHRAFLERLALVGAGTVIVVIGGIYMYKNPKAGKEMIAKGKDMMKAASKEQKRT